MSLRAVSLATKEAMALKNPYSLFHRISTLLYGPMYERCTSTAKAMQADADEDPVPTVW
jgi:hypothetical protein